MRPLNYLVVLVITALIFLTGMWVGDQIADFKVDNLIALQEKVRINSAAASLQMDLLEDGFCSIDIFDVTEERFQLGKQLAQLEGQVGFNDENVLRLKNQYSILNIQQFLLLNKQIKACGTEITPILFFYDNVDAKTESKTQGYILDYVYKTHPKDVVIYSFDVNVRNSAVDTLIEQYDVGDVPTIIIDGQKYEGVVTSAELFSILGIAA